MSSTAEAVNEHLERDLILRVGLSRGIINLRRASRWLLKHNGWDATEEAVVSALRRYVPKLEAPAFEEALALLEAAEGGVRTGLALVVVPRVGEDKARASRTWELLGKLDMLGAFPGRRKTTYLVEERAVSVVRRLCAGARIDRARHPVSQVHLAFPVTGPTVGIAAAIFVGALGYQGVEILEVFSSDREFSVVVSDQDTELAHEVIMRLRRST